MPSYKNDQIEEFVNAAFEGDLEQIKSLLKSGLNVNVKNKNQSTALFAAVENLQIEIVEFLLANGADVNAACYCGQTALHNAIDIEMEDAVHRYDLFQDLSSPRSDITQLLLIHGANPLQKSDLGETPLDWAINRGHTAAQALIESFIGSAREKWRDGSQNK